MHPTLFEIPGLETGVQSYGVCVGLALVVGWVLALRLARADRLPADRLGTAYVLSVGVGLFGARAVFLAQHPDRIEGIDSFVQLQAGGLAAGAGILISAAVSALYCARRGIPFWAWADAAAPAMVFGLALERLGAFLAGADFGILAGAGGDPWWAVSFPAESPAWTYQRNTVTGLRIPTDRSLPVHPVQLYGASAALVGVALAAALRRRRTFSGQVATFLLAFHVVARLAFEDPFRAAASPESLAAMPVRHLGAAAIVVAALVLYLTRRARARAEPGRLEQWKGGPWTPSA